jgi:hypothetical protein
MISKDMHQRAGLLFLSKNTKRVLLIQEDQRWTVPTFSRKSTLLEDAQDLLKNYCLGRIIPIELYLSADKGFEYSTYVCVVEQDFLVNQQKTYAWCYLDDLPKNLHTGLKNTLGNQVIRTKIDTIMELENDIAARI